MLSLLVMLLPVNAHANRSVEDAISWADAQIGSNQDSEHNNQAWAGMCMHFCGHVYGLSQSGFPEAKDGWADTGSTFGNKNTSTDFNSIPRGALVFFSTNLFPTGHVGVSVGNGRMVHAWVAGVKIDSIDNLAQYYLGWRWPNGWTSDLPSSAPNIQYRLVGNVAWSPPNKSCLYANMWIFFQNGYPNGGQSLGSNSICQQEEYEMMMTLGGVFSNWWKVLYSPVDLVDNGICTQ
ncbi:MAG: hypothetical protein UR99_C0025G0004 [Candidatus Moranbacteria bacterium GW2011_GWD2_36_12]|nr:MAG: hypothetical protein UR99_C0025G0004 [Candidatus Moranbacteria bacterium GW2011_GWD2_36_12]KKQ06054.1 MAG: hypothetical protein US16_C0026G0004 [Candidatus Moranbacteria bacterium GW2011_GWE2_36_40]